MHFSKDSKYLLTSSIDGSIRLWLTGIGRCVVTYRGFSHPVLCVRFCPSNSSFAACTSNGMIYMYNTDDIQYASKITTQYDFSVIDWTPDNALVAGLANGHVIRFM